MKFIHTLVAAAAFVAVGAAPAAPTTVNIVGAKPGAVGANAPKVSINGGASYGAVNDYEWIVSSTAPAGTFAAFCLDPNRDGFFAFWRPLDAHCGVPEDNMLQESER